MIRHCGTSALSKKSQRNIFQVLLDALTVASKELPRALQMIEDGISRTSETTAPPATARLYGLGVDPCVTTRQQHVPCTQA